MNNRMFSVVKDSLLITLLIYTLIVSWNSGGLLAFISIVVLGIVLGLLTKVYEMDSLEFSKQVGIHVGGSVLAILLVAIFNSWLIIDWGKVFTFILILAILAVLGYGGYMYYKNKKENPSQVATPADFDNTDHSLDEGYRTNADDISKAKPVVEKDYHKEFYDKGSHSAFGDYHGVHHEDDLAETSEADTYGDEEVLDGEANAEYVETPDSQDVRPDESVVDETAEVIQEAEENMDSTYTYPEEDELNNN